MFISVFNIYSSSTLYLPEIFTLEISYSNFNWTLVGTLNCFIYGFFYLLIFVFFSI